MITESKIRGKMNFLRPRLWPEEDAITVEAILGVIFLAVLLIFPLQLFFNWGILILLTLVLLGFLLRGEWGMYLLAAVSFFYGWEISFSKYSWGRNISYLSSINAPLVDFIAAALIGMAVLAIILKIRKFSWQQLKYLLIPAAVYGLFLLSALISWRGAYEHLWGTSIKYFFRSMVFVFTAFMILPGILVERKETLMRILKIWFWAGVAVALFGLSSFFVVAGAGWPRVTPYGIGSFAPLGYNHNLIGEVLVAIIPLGLYFYSKARAVNSSWAKWYIGGTGLMVAAALLTLSRAAWLSLAVEAIIGAWFWRERAREWIRRQKGAAVFAAAIFLLAVVYMAVFTTSEIAKNSTSSRLQMTEISLFYAQRQPFFGYGPGMYIQIMGDTFDWTQEHGDPLESHGLIQKILLEEGVVGLTLFFAFLAVVFWQLWRHQHEGGDNQMLFRMLLLMAAGAVMFQFFNTSYFASVMWLPMGVALAARKNF